MVAAKVKIWRKRSRTPGARPSARRRYFSELRRTAGAKAKKYAAIRYSMARPARRPRRSERNTIRRSSVALPRSGSPTHGAALARGAVSVALAAMIPCALKGQQHAACDLLAATQHAAGDR